MSKTVKGLRKVLALVIGVPVFILGLILIPLPGPGILVCFLGLLILSMEFEWAAKHRDRAKAELKKIVDQSKSQQNKRK